jgi:hypothetical protein
LEENMSSDLKQRYNEKVRIVTEVINKWDPANLFPDAPDDEYESEISKIVSYLKEANSETMLAEGIKTIFNNSFDWKLTNEKCLPTAKEIQNELAKI